MAEDRNLGESIEPDSKSQVTMAYENGRHKLVVISTQHSKDLNQQKLRDYLSLY